MIYKRVLRPTLQKLNDPLTSPKAYWPILKTFYSDTKIVLIPPLITHSRVIINFREKTNFLNIFLLRDVRPL